MSNTKEVAPGPYKSTRTHTVKLSALEFSTVTVEEATHPPAPCGCGGSDNSLIEMIGQAVQAASASGAFGAPPPTVAPSE